ncbi:DUF3788 domain-containing protein [Beduini massiliensis]|uniref:DUF3788 domain-containing protein n=1 Tax=Beduini massiliensis TaxID=1585974 RepID=UPI00059A97AB|nr:DUF3788 domain-containing protein [Beduini massiliensis]
MDHWDKLDAASTPNLEETATYINNPLFQELCDYFDKTFHCLPQFHYSRCSMAKGWNLKFKKSSKNICTVYPCVGYFKVLIVIGRKEKEAFEKMLPSLSASFQMIYAETKEMMHQRWLMLSIEDSNQLEDLKKCILVRAK